MRHVLQAILFLPVLILQGLWVAARAQRLPPAAGPTSDRIGEGAPLRILMLGDSSAAGMGAQTQDEALMGQLAQALSDDFEVHWTLIAKGGVTSSQALSMLLASEAAPCDVAVVCLGVNDTKNGVSTREWKRSYAAVFAELRARGASQIIACGLPPLGSFPLLPWPLRQTLGARADSLDRHLQALVEAEPTAVHVPSLFEMDPAMMASDGFHPGPVLYSLWGQGLADVIRAQR